MAEVRAHYDASSATYSEQYDERRVLISAEYPANYFRLKRIKRRVQDLGLQSMYELGFGDGTPLAELGLMGLQVAGSDISTKMLEVAQQQFAARGLDPNVLTLADWEDPDSLKSEVAKGPFDGVMALGVLPHVRDDRRAVESMRDFIGPGGTMFLQFRNSMLSLYSFNRLTLDFIMDELLEEADAELRDAVRQELEPRLAMDKPPKRVGTAEAPGYDEILARFHNPFELADLVRGCGFDDLRFHWYNYHVAPPMLSGKLGQLFRTEGMRYEDSDSWRGMFLCSAGVIEATLRSA